MTAMLIPGLGRPGYEGANIRTWVGFKHFDYLVEEAVLHWFRDRGLGPARLYHDHGLGLELVDCSMLLPAVLDVDDVVSAEVSQTKPGRFAVRLTTTRDGATVTVCRAKATVALVRETDPPAAGPAPADLVNLVTESTPGAEARPAAGFSWSYRVPYFHCHFSDRVAHSAYARTLEDTVDRFLYDRGIGVGRLLAERGWIPVVSRSRITMLADAHLDDTMTVTFSAGDIIGGVTFDGRMDCYAQRGDDPPRHVATATILHGYAISRGPDAGTLATLDDDVLKALQ
ncbi:hypothetical protein N5079_23295 [Planotetraspora sp. A-T 1434]|uniref:acyl-CoA thioesterase n=1 Tax=Planotetraspora sp. A-T 1434 TaxID=2979219 RepID=UPI0021BFDF11|nr:hypothetical protein [Planotetraspora sp. A-T 1434]MCT9933139.1 hypothetical protein [Planotetraspora sp. A-T 1434]